MFHKKCKITSEEGETSSAMSKNVYEVFLSFRGPDTRQGFTDCLYHAMVDAGITVFRDDDELRPGDKLLEILTALDNSKLCVVVFSRTFAVSAWCLREVERMIGMKKEIVPIFVDVTPDDVKLKTPLYDDALTVHETKYGKEQAQQWREALMEITRIKGRELKNFGFVEFSRQLVKQILTKIKLKNKYEIPELVEVPDEVEDALKLLNIESHDERRFLGIHGMGGMGKTTLAKIVFNQISDSFDCSCFLENVRDSLSQGQDGLTRMQEKLLKSLNPSSIDVKKNFTNKKVIIVLDDIDEKSQIHSLVGDSGWFGLGSRIIFTTRKASLHEQVISSNATFHGLEKKEMNSKQALELFSKHAFGRDSPPENFKDLANEVISVTSGLPLALEVVGSSLCRKKVKVWRSMICKLKETPILGVQQKLRLSYDTLEPEQQEIFLDIACFFIGKDKKNAVYMWEACDFYPDHGIEVLISMSLIKITPRMHTKSSWIHEKCFWMHDQLRDLGRAIVNEKYGDPRAGSRLCVTSDALDQLRRNSGKEKVEAIQLDGRFTALDREDFVSLKKLRFLSLTDTRNFSGEFTSLLPKLRWLSLRIASFNATNLCHKELVVLELFRCSLDVDWHGLSQFLMLENLKVLTISECEELISMPDLSKLVNLERLEFSNCDNLTSIHNSIGKLQCLKHLALKLSNYSCRRSHLNLPESISNLVRLATLSLCYMGLTKLPKDIGELVKLKRLSLCGCEALKIIPESIGDLRSLVSLNLSSTGISHVPTTIGQLTKLESLNLSWCSSLHTLPISIGKMQSLIDLNLDNSGIEQLPNSLGDLASLQNLHLRDSRVTSLPSSVRDLQKLKVLDLGTSGGGVKTWIDEVHELPTGLTMLTIYNAQKIQRLSNLINLSHLEIDNIGMLAQLTEFSMFVVIEGIEKLCKLKHLKLMCSAVKSLSMELNALQQLKSLKLHCLKLEFGKCHLPSSLELLDIKVNDWGELLLNISSLKNLTKADLTHLGADEVEEMEHEACYAKSVSMDLSALQKLKSLTLHCRKLEFGQCQLPSSLESLDLKVKDWGELPLNIPSLKNLSKLKLINFGADEIRGMEQEAGYAKSFSMDLSALKKLKSLTLDCPKLEFRQCWLPSSLELLELKVKDWGDLLFNLPSLKNLSKLKLINFGADKVEGMEQVAGCAKIVSMDLSALQKLKSLKLYCPKLEFRQCQLPSSLESLNLKVKDWGALLLIIPSLKNLSTLDLTHFGANEVEGMKQEACYAKSVFMDLSALQKLKSLKLRCSKLEFRQSQLPPSLQSLELKVKQWGQLPINLSCLKNLWKLKLTNFSMEGFYEIEGLESLKELDLSSCEFPSKFLDISLLYGLQKLWISRADGLVEISGIGKVKHLSISECESFQRIANISKLNGLPTIYVWKCRNFLGIDGIDKVVLPALTSVNISECKCKDVCLEGSKWPSKEEEEDM